MPKYDVTEVSNSVEETMQKAHLDSPRTDSSTLILKPIPKVVWSRNSSGRSSHTFILSLLIWNAMNAPEHPEQSYIAITWMRKKFVSMNRKLEYELWTNISFEFFDMTCTGTPEAELPPSPEGDQNECIWTGNSSGHTFILSFCTWRTPGASRTELPPAPESRKIWWLWTGN